MVILSMMICVVLMGGYVLLALLLPLAGLALNLVVGFLTAGSLLLLLLFLGLRRLWRRSGRMDRAYVDQYTGWKRWGLLAVSWGLTALVVWEALVFVLGVLYFIFRPAFF